MAIVKMKKLRLMAVRSSKEALLRELIRQGAEIDAFGIGERLITSKSSPVFGAVYKLCAVEHDGEIIPKIKISENVGKITTPHFKKVYRLRGRESGKDMKTAGNQQFPAAFS